MAYELYRIPTFYGINQSSAENMIRAGESPDACNMDTSGGRLSVAKGYVHDSEAKIAGYGTVRRLFVWNRPSGRVFVAAAGSSILKRAETDAAWSAIYTYTDAAANPERFDFQVMKVASEEMLLIACGRTSIVKWNGTDASASAFGSAEALSDIAVNDLEVYYGRLFSAGDGAHPARLYWSCTPGGTRTVEDWSSAEESANVSGGYVEVGTDSDPITGIYALSNQLVIFKRDSVYRLLGDRPSNWRIVPVNAAMRQPAPTAVVRYGDVLYFLTRGGLYCFDGQNVNRLRNAENILSFLAGADTSNAVGAVSGDRLYFLVREGEGDAMLVYDLMRMTYMVRRGFSPVDLASAGDTLYLLTTDGFVSRFNEGTDYAGKRIDAYWTTPMTDFDEKIADKRLRELYVRGTGGIAAVEAISVSGQSYYERILPDEKGDVLEVPLSGEGRAFRLRISNVNGSGFSIDGGLELLTDVQRRVL